MKPKSPGRANFNDVAITKEMSNPLAAYPTNEDIIDICTVGGFKILAIDQRRDFALLLLIDDGIYTEVLLGDLSKRVGNIKSARSP